MRKSDGTSSNQSLRNPFALPALGRPGKVLKDRRQGRAGATDWQRQWLTEWFDEQLTFLKKEETHEQR